MTHPYYQTRKDAIATTLDTSLSLAAQRFREAGIDLEPLQPDIARELDRVISQLPYVGGAQGRMTPYFEQYAGIIALGRVLSAAGVTPVDLADLLTATFLARLAALETPDRMAMGRAFLSATSKAELRRLADESQLREHAGDFVYSFVETGTDETGHVFEFGLDYQECGFCKMCARTGDLDILPMICSMDEELYRLRGIRLTRTQTLAGGASHCNFRYSPLPPQEEPEGAGPKQPG